MPALRPETHSRIARAAIRASPRERWAGVNRGAHRGTEGEEEARWERERPMGRTLTTRSLEPEAGCPRPPRGAECPADARQGGGRALSRYRTAGRRRRPDDRRAAPPPDRELRP